MTRAAAAPAESLRRRRADEARPEGRRESPSAKPTRSARPRRRCRGRTSSSSRASRSSRAAASSSRRSRGVTINDNLIRHYVVRRRPQLLPDRRALGRRPGAVLHQAARRREAELIGLQYNRIADAEPATSTAARSTSATCPSTESSRWFNKRIVHWEIWASAGVGATFTEVIPRDPPSSSAFKNTTSRRTSASAALLPARLADRELRAPRLHHPRQVRADQLATAARRSDATTKADAESAAGQQRHGLRRASGIYLPDEVHLQDPSLARRDVPRSTKDMPMLTTQTKPLASRAPGRASPSDALAAGRPGATQEPARRRARDPQALRAAFDPLRDRRRRIGTTIDQDFYHTRPGQVKLGFHITDWLSLAGFGGLRGREHGDRLQRTARSALCRTRRCRSIARPRSRRPAAMQKINERVRRASWSSRRSPASTRCSASCSRTTTSTRFAGPGFINVKPSDGRAHRLHRRRHGGRACAVNGMKFGATFGVGMHTLLHPVRWR